MGNARGFGKWPAKAHSFVAHRTFFSPEPLPSPQLGKKKSRWLSTPATQPLSFRAPGMKINPRNNCDK